MSALVTFEIFRLFVNTMSPDDKYSLRNMQIFWKQLQTLLSQKRQAFHQFLIAFLKCAWNFENSEKKRRVSLRNFYRNYCIRKRCLLKRLKGLASAHHSVINVLTGSKNCWSQHRTTILLFLHEFEINWVVESLPESHLKSSDCSLTRWLPMPSIPVGICRFSDNKFQRLYLNKKTHFMDFLLNFRNVHEN